METKVRQKKNSLLVDVHPQRVYNITTGTHRGRECRWGRDCKSNSCIYEHPDRQNHQQQRQPRQSYTQSRGRDRVEKNEHRQTHIQRRDRSSSPMGNKCRFAVAGQACPFGRECKYEHTQQPGHTRDSSDNRHRPNGGYRHQYPRQDHTNTSNNQVYKPHQYQSQPHQRGYQAPHTTQARQEENIPCTICTQNGNKGIASTHKEDAHCTFCKVAIHSVDTCILAWKHNNKCITCGERGHNQDNCSIRPGLN